MFPERINMPEAVFFDMDGTLVDSELLYARALAATVCERGGELSVANALQIVIGQSWEYKHEVIDQLHPGMYASASELEACAAEFFDGPQSYVDLCISSSLELLRRLAKNLPVGIVSGSSRGHLLRLIEEIGIGNELKLVLGFEDYSPGKPDPACYNLAAKQLSMTSHRCLVFEDSTVGVLAAKAAGMMCVGFARPGGPTQNLTSADLVLENLSEFEFEMLPIRQP